MKAWAAISHSGAPQTLKRRHGRVSRGVLTTACVARAKVSTIKMQLLGWKAERQSSTWGADCWLSGRKWEDGHTFYSQGVVTSVSKDASRTCVCDSGPQPPTTAHLTGAFIADEGHEWRRKLLEHFSDSAALKVVINRTFGCCTARCRKDTCGQRCTTVWRATHSPAWSYCVVPPVHHPEETRKICHFSHVHTKLPNWE